MAIKIPSKNIYEVNNSKIKDNYVDNIVVGYNDVSVKEKYNQAVYDEKKPLDTPTFIDSQTQNEYIMKYGDGSGNWFNTGLAVVHIRKGYNTITSRIPIVGANSYIKDIDVGQNNNGMPNIKYSLIGKTRVGTASSIATRESGLTGSNPKVTIGDVPTTILSTSSKGILNLPDKNTEITKSVMVSGSEHTLTSKVNDTYSNITSAKTTVVNIGGIDYFEITITYLTYLLIAKLNGVENINIQVNNDIPLNGTFIRYDASEIEINFFGTTKGVETNILTTTIGLQNGRNPIEIDGNELMQEGSKIISNYQKTLSSYTYGKEVVVLKCDIDDYYDFYTGEKIISSNNHQLLNSADWKNKWNANYSDGKVTQVQADTSNSYRFHIQAYNGEIFYKELNDITINNTQRISLTFKKESDFSHIRFKLNGASIDTGILYDISNLENGRIYCFSANVNIDGGQGSVYWYEMQISLGARQFPYESYGKPMTFNIYDKVILMKKAQGNADIPLSFSQDGKPKVFEVLGVNINTKGKVYQELYVQEV